MEDNKKIEKERAAINTLLDKGLNFEVPRSLFGRKRKPRVFTIRQPYLGTLDSLSELYLQMGFSEEALKANPMQEGRKLSAENAKIMARVVAVAVLNSYWGIRLFTGILARYFLWRVTPSTLFQLAMIINTISNVADFTNSIRLLSLVRTTQPKADRIE